MSRILLLFCLYCCALTPYLCSALTDAQKEQIHEHFEKLGTECVVDYPITPEDIASLKAKEVPNGAHVPCFIACLFRKIGVLDDHGLLAHEVALDLAKKVFDNDDELKAARDFLGFCSKVNFEAVSDGDKGCDRAMFGYKCMMENAARFGLQL